MKFEKIQKVNLLYFNNFATIIQKNFRGYYLRKYGRNFFDRKNNLKQINQKNMKTLKMMQDYEV